MTDKRARTALWAAILMLIFAVAAPTFALAAPPKERGQGRGKHKHERKKDEKFKNGHDARDGRWDGRGPRDRDDEEDNDRGGGHRRSRDRDGDGVNDRTEITRRASDIGYQEGYRAGRDDRANNDRFDYDDESAYRDATTGYRDNYGDLTLYRRSFRDGFRRGYEDGYQNRDSRRGVIGDILGDIFSRP